MKPITILIGIIICAYSALASTPKQSNQTNQTNQTNQSNPSKQKYPLHISTFPTHAQVYFKATASQTQMPDEVTPFYSVFTTPTCTLTFVKQGYYDTIVVVHMPYNNINHAIIKLKGHYYPEDTQAQNEYFATRSKKVWGKRLLYSSIAFTTYSLFSYYKSKQWSERSDNYKQHLDNSLFTQGDQWEYNSQNYSDALQNAQVWETNALLSAILAGAGIGLGLVYRF